MAPRKHYDENMQAALPLIHTELEAHKIFSRAAREAAAVGDAERAARNRTLAASAVDGARRIAKARVEMLYRCADQRLPRGDSAGAASFTEQAVILAEQLERFIEAAISDAARRSTAPVRLPLSARRTEEL
jgi:hypothetical protein